VSSLSVTAPDGVPEVRPGDDLAGLLLARVDRVDGGLRDGDVVAVTSKVVSKAEGRVREGDREEALAAETARLVARRGPTTIVRTRHGLTMAAAGIDASNVEAGRLVLLPEDPDRSARGLREALRERAGCNVGVLVTDTAGRAWREGQTDIAVGAAGIRVLESFAGREDAFGNPLVVTSPAVADELAGAAELAQGKLARRPFAVLRGRADLVLPPGDHGPGAAALVRPEGADMFGYGAREAVVRALRGDAGDQPPFGAAADADELVSALVAVLGDGPAVALDAEGVACDLADPRLVRVAAAVAFAHGWTVASPGAADNGGARLRLRPATP
jgi:coenzyme F420-0:L-glutamate ligase/coenzyme F420-1:gamma-L-glutamate ligase